MIRLQSNVFEFSRQHPEMESCTNAQM